VSSFLAGWKEGQRIGAMRGACKCWNGSIVRPNKAQLLPTIPPAWVQVQNQAWSVREAWCTPSQFATGARCSQPSLIRGRNRLAYSVPSSVLCRTLTHCGHGREPDLLKEAYREVVRISDPFQPCLPLNLTAFLDGRKQGGR
jgi:hypothetical protein